MNATEARKEWAKIRFRAELTSVQSLLQKLAVLAEYDVLALRSITLLTDEQLTFVDRALSIHTEPSTRVANPNTPAHIRHALTAAKLDTLTLAPSATQKLVESLTADKHAELTAGIDLLVQKIQIPSEESGQFFQQNGHVSSKSGLS